MLIPASPQFCLSNGRHFPSRCLSDMAFHWPLCRRPHTRSTRRHYARGEFCRPRSGVQRADYSPFEDSRQHSSFVALVNLLENDTDSFVRRRYSLLCTDTSAVVTPCPLLTRHDQSFPSPRSFLTLIHLPTPQTSAALPLPGSLSTSLLPHHRSRAS